MEKVEHGLKKIRSLLSSSTQIEKQMSLFPEENILTKEIESRRVFADALKSNEDKKLFPEMLQKYPRNSLFKKKLLLKGQLKRAETVVVRY